VKVKAPFRIETPPKSNLAGEQSDSGELIRDGYEVRNLLFAGSLGKQKLLWLWGLGRIRDEKEKPLAE